MINAKQAADALISWCDKRGTQKGVKEFVAYTQENDVTYVLKQVMKIMKDKTRAKKETGTLRVNAGRRITKSQLASIVSAFDAEGDATKVTTEESLIAGASAEFNNRRVSSTVESRLDDLARSLHTSR